MTDPDFAALVAARGVTLSIGDIPARSYAELDWECVLQRITDYEVAHGETPRKLDVRDLATIHPIPEPT